jgi:hypothetical protein
MLTLVFVTNTLFTIIWILKSMRHSANPGLPFAALGWLLGYLWAPQALLVITAVLTPTALAFATRRRTTPPTKGDTITRNSYDSASYRIPVPCYPTVYPTQCLSCA